MSWSPAAVWADNKVNRLLLCRSLELMGHQVRSADNGLQALQMLRLVQPDLLLLDLAMPALDGFGLLRLRAGDPVLREVSVIVTSALDGVAPMARCIELGADDFLHKPVDPWLLKARVDASLARKQRHDLQAQALRHLLPGGPTEPVRLADTTVLRARLQDLQCLRPLATPQETMALLSDWSTLMFGVIGAEGGAGGDLVQFSGDGLTVLFADPQAAARAAQEMHQTTAQFNDERAASGMPALVLGLGLARGPVLVGTVSTGQRMAQACIGEPVARAEALAAADASARQATAPGPG